MQRPSFLGCNVVSPALVCARHCGCAVKPSLSSNKSFYFDDAVKRNLMSALRQPSNEVWVQIKLSNWLQRGHPLWAKCSHRETWKTNCHNDDCKVHTPLIYTHHKLRSQRVCCRHWSQLCRRPSNWNNPSDGVNHPLRKNYNKMNNEFSHLTGLHWV